ncbi:sugar kinase [Sphingomonas japonica]|uniref:2-dehydro-3-deoxygluconokinase n=1 Tax=Sphingomonas japonica TaxID=511662 RepID=A0ABX0U2T8_9SPHN|nr:sugar kinase [Sphingomonas japonica]NIJ23043.1 2-dehydro-3-deoxygluconokinase [Sphingomonas japonica]
MLRLTDCAEKPVVGFGELLLRLSPPTGELPLQSPHLAVHVGGAEANVLVGLARLGHATRLVSAVPPGPVGDAARAGVARWGVDIGHVATADGRMGLYYLIPGAGLRASEVVYDRAGSAFAERESGAWDWDAALAGAGHLHLSGITPALGEAACAATLAAARAARARGMTVSFDGNYRAKLWQRWAGDPVTSLRALVAEADILFGDHRDIALLLGTPASPDDAVAAAFEAFANLTLIASTTREVVDARHHRIAARVDLRGGEAGRAGPVALTDIVDRIGGGDAFAAGVLHALIEGEDAQGAAMAGLGLAALKHSLMGDASLFTRADLAAFSLTGGDVRR